MLTDGEATVELGEWTSEKRAQRAAARLEACFGLDDGSPVRRRAVWRGVKYGGPLLVLLYVIGMGIYIRFWGS